MRPRPAAALPALIAGAALLGFAAIFVRWAEGASPLVVGFYRMLFALPLVAVLTLSGARPRREDARGFLWAALGGLSFTTDLWMWHQAIHWTTAASATLLVGLAPLWVALLGVLILGQKLRTWGWVGLALALSGVVVLGMSGGARLGSGRGEVLGFLASFGYAGYMLCLAKARQSLSAPQAMLGAVASSTLAFGFLALLQGHAFTGFGSSTWLALLGLGLVVQVVAWWLITWSFGHLPSSLGALGLLVQQVATVLLGAILLKEVPGPAQGAGIALVLTGFALAAAHPPVVRTRSPR